MVQVFETQYSFGKQEEATGSWLQTSPASAAAVIWKVNLQMEDISVNLPFK